MGADFDYFTIKRKKQLVLKQDLTPVYYSGITHDEIKDAYVRYCQEAAFEDGHSYSGRLNMTTCLDIHVMPLFYSKLEAIEYIQNNAEKWGKAIAVKYTDGEIIGWVVGGICSS